MTRSLSQPTFAFTCGIATLLAAALIAPSAFATTGSLLRELTAPDVTEFDRFGGSVAIDGGVALVAAYGDDDNGSNSGSAYLYDTTTGSLLHKLTAPDGAAEDFFGSSVAIDRGVALIGASGNDDNGSNSGSAYLYDAMTGSLLHKLTAPDGAANDFFGASVAINGGVALVAAAEDDDNGSASGSAYLFDTATGSLLHKLTAPDGAIGDAFGSSVAIDENVALIGASSDDDNGSFSGSAYLFDTTTGSLLHKLTAPDGAIGDAFGSSVAIDRGVALISAIGDDGMSAIEGFDSGSAYLFDATTGSLLHQLTAPAAAAFDRFGNSVALDEGVALVGAAGKDGESPYQSLNSGAAYLFDATTGSLLRQLAAPDAADGDSFGGSVAIDEGIALVGADGDSDNGSFSGSAYIFVPEPSNALLAATALGLQLLSSVKVRPRSLG